MSDQEKPVVFQLFLEGLRHMDTELYREMCKVATVRPAQGADEALALLAENPRPHAIYYAARQDRQDSTDPKHHMVAQRVIDYARGGSTVVLGPYHPTTGWPVPDAAWITTHWGLPWRLSAPIHGSSVLNLAASGRPAGDGPWHAGLPGLYEIAGCPLINLAPEDCLYLCAPEPDYPEEPDEAPEDSEDEEGIDVDSIHPRDIRASVALTRVGEGYVGYAADTKLRDGTKEVVFAMMGLKSL